MAIEIERKFLVLGEDWRQSDPLRIRQGYLSRDEHRTVRVRIAGEHAFLTVKGITHKASRLEFEYEIPVEDAEQLLLLCVGPLIEKNRHIVNHAGTRWEIDEFLGVNLGLVMAEVELESVGQPLDLPGWTGMEVTHDERYFNSNLSIRPHSAWRKP
ncbi:MAG: CYTH domain-containing protein [Proteobacteria bacterium]|nr:CYTH domain-containing protein [Pseudomonadota bacterium]